MRTAERTLADLRHVPREVLRRQRHLMPQTTTDIDCGA